MSSWHGVLIGALLLMATARAVAVQLIAEPEESAVGCLTVGDAKLAYPRGKAERKEGGVVRVRLTFTSAEAPPRIEVPFAPVDDAFRDAVVERVESYRLPCLRVGGAPVVAVQEFQFVPGDGRKVIWSEMRDAEPVSNPLVACLTGADHLPSYPANALGHGQQGTVFAHYTFTDGRSPPEVTILYDGGVAAFARAVRDYAQGFRLPCIPPGGRRVDAMQTFTFALDGEHRSRLKDTTLANFLGVVDHLQDQRVRFDFTTMSCPFEVRFVLREPYLRNAVGELEKADPNRREFVEWLTRVKLDIPSRDLSQVMGDSMTITVPCSIVDLT